MILLGNCGIVMGVSQKRVNQELKGVFLKNSPLFLYLFMYNSCTIKKGLYIWVWKKH